MKKKFLLPLLGTALTSLVLVSCGMKKITYEEAKVIYSQALEVVKAEDYKEANSFEVRVDTIFINNEENLDVKRTYRYDTLKNYCYFYEDYKNNVKKTNTKEESYIYVKDGYYYDYWTDFTKTVATKKIFDSSVEFKDTIDEDLAIDLKNTIIGNYVFGSMLLAEIEKYKLSIEYLSSGEGSLSIASDNTVDDEDGNKIRNLFEVEINNYEMNRFHELRSAEEATRDIDVHYAYNLNVVSYLDEKLFTTK